MKEQRKRAILFAATLLCARKLIESIESDKPNLANKYFVNVLWHADVEHSRKVKSQHYVRLIVV
jgi:hypothetical protein